MLIDHRNNIYSPRKVLVVEHGRLMPVGDSPVCHQVLARRQRHLAAGEFVAAARSRERDNELLISIHHFLWESFSSGLTNRNVADKW